MDYEAFKNMVRRVLFAARLCTQLLLEIPLQKWSVGQVAVAHLRPLQARALRQAGAHLVHSVSRHLLPTYITRPTADGAGTPAAMSSLLWRCRYCERAGLGVPGGRFMRGCFTWPRKCRVRDTGCQFLVQ